MSSMLKDLLAKVFFKLYLNMIGAAYIVREQILDRHRQLSGITKQNGKTIVITGGTRGIGFEAVKKMLELDCHIIMGCRRPDQAKETFDKLRSEGLTGGSIEFLALDLMAMSSVRQFAQAIVNRSVGVNVLVNNAGIMFGPRKETIDSFESQLATNYIGHFLLTHLLLPILEKSGSSASPSRIVNVSSVAHFLGSWMDMEDIHLTKLYSPELSYGNSKAAQE